MRKQALTEDDEELIAAAKDILKEHFHPESHQCSAAIRSSSGAVYTAINLISGGQADVHSEPIALGKAVEADDADIQTSVAVMHETHDASNPIRVVSACGVCREMYRTFAPDVNVIVRDDDALVKVPLRDLLPAKPTFDN